MLGANRNAGIWRPSLEQIDSTVSSQLGPGRVSGNEQGPCFSRQISMYLAKHVGGWSMVKIGRFYNGRHHTTVLHAIQKVQRLRSEDESIDALIEVLIAALSENVRSGLVQSTAGPWPPELIEAITGRVIYRLVELRQESTGFALVEIGLTRIHMRENFAHASFASRILRTTVPTNGLSAKSIGVGERSGDGLRFVGRSLSRPPGCCN